MLHLQTITVILLKLHCAVHALAYSKRWQPQLALPVLDARGTASTYLLHVNLSCAKPSYELRKHCKTSSAARFASCVRLRMPAHELHAAPIHEQVIKYI